MEGLREAEALLRKARAKLGRPSCCLRPGSWRTP